MVKYLDIAKILYSKNRHILRVFLDLAGYRKLFLESEIDLKNCEMSLGMNIILLLNKKGAIAYRCSLNKFGYTAILRNHDFLNNVKIDIVPLPRGLWKRNNIVIGAESLMYGKKLKAEDIDGKVITKVLEQLRFIHKNNIIKVRFDSEEWFKKSNYFLPYYNPLWIKKLNIFREEIIKKSCFFQKSGAEVVNTRIHGDLTFRNIMLNGKDIVFLDFDRSDIDFPEFDLFLFCTDNLTHRKRLVDYDRFFDNIMEFVRGKIVFSECELFYNMNPEFGINKNNFLAIKYLFLYRTLALILQAFDKRDYLPLRLLDKVIYEIAK